MALAAPSQARRVLMGSRGVSQGHPRPGNPGCPLPRGAKGPPAGVTRAQGPFLPSLPHTGCNGGMSQEDLPGPSRIGGQSGVVGQHAGSSHTDLGWGPSCSA